MVKITNPEILLRIHRLSRSTPPQEVQQYFHLWLDQARKQMDTCLYPSQVSCQSPQLWQVDHLESTKESQDVNRRKFNGKRYIIEQWKLSLEEFEWKQSPVIILTFTPRLRALRMVSALSCLGGSNSGRRPTNCHGPPGDSFDFSGTSCKRIKANSVNLSGKNSSTYFKDK